MIFWMIKERIKERMKESLTDQVPTLANESLKNIALARSTISAD
jgi:hypothetical protein